MDSLRGKILFFFLMILFLKLTDQYKQKFKVFLILQLNLIKHERHGNFLVIQQLGIRQSEGHGFDPWSGKIPCAVEQLSLCAATTEPVCQGPMPCNENHCNG